MILKGEHHLERFKTFSLEDQKHLTILCRKGAIWVTAGAGFGDIVLKSGQSISLIANNKIVIEALEDSYAVYAHSTKENKNRLALQN